MPYFCVDVSGLEDALVVGVLEGGEGSGEEGKLEFVEPRAAAAGFTPFEAAVFAEARSMTDWNARNQVRWFLRFFLLLSVRERRRAVRYHFPPGALGPPSSEKNCTYVSIHE